MTQFLRSSSMDNFTINFYSVKLFLIFLIRNIIFLHQNGYDNTGLLCKNIAFSQHEVRWL